MSGRPKQKTFQYDKEGKFIRAYECLADVRKRYYYNDGGVRPMFVNKDYELLPDNTYLVKERIGRKGITLLDKIINSKYTFKNKKLVSLINVKNEEIAIFANIHIAHRLTQIPYSTIYNQLNESKNSKHLDLRFQYK